MCKTDSTASINHTWDRRHILLETSAAGAVEVVYTSMPTVHGNLISQTRSGTDSIFLFDAVGSTRQLLNRSGGATDGYLYDSFGNAIAGGTSGTTMNPFRYVGQCGYYTDQELGTYYLYGRTYDHTRGLVSSVGRVLSWPPIAISTC